MINPLSGNGALAVIEALAAGADTGKQAGDLAQAELESGDLLQAIQQQIAQFGGNMTAVEDFIAAYIASKIGVNISVGEGQAIDALTTLLGKLKADDAEGSKYGDKITKDQAELAELSKELKELSGECNYGACYRYCMEQDPFGNAITWAIEAAIRLKQLGDQMKDIGDQIKPLGADIREITGKVEALAKDQETALAGLSGKFQSQSGQMVSGAKSDMSGIEQLLSLVFYFLSQLQFVSVNK